MAEPKAARLTRESGTSFYYAFRLLPAEKRRAIYALYSFCRVVDDCVDEQGGEGEAGLERWLEEVQRCLCGRAATELGRELQRAVVAVPDPAWRLRGHRGRLPDGPHPPRYDDVRRPAGLLRARGLRGGPRLHRDLRLREPHAPVTTRRTLGLALQLTNILRDVAEDAAKGRLYLPLEDLRALRRGTEEEVLAAARPGSRGARRLQRAPGLPGRARARHYERARAEPCPTVDRRSMLSAEIMGAVYRALLEEMAAPRLPLGGRAARLSRPRKAWLALRTVPRRLLDL